jgi:hypothetical protein
MRSDPHAQRTFLFFSGWTVRFPEVYLNHRKVPCRCRRFHYISQDPPPAIHNFSVPTHPDEIDDQAADWLSLWRRVRYLEAGIHIVSLLYIPFLPQTSLFLPSLPHPQICSGLCSQNGERKAEHVGGGGRGEATNSWKISSVLRRAAA